MNESHVLAPGRVAVVTGAASGIGYAAALRFAKLGMRVCAADIASQTLDQSAADFAAAHPQGWQAILSVPTDVADEPQVQALCDAVYTAFGEVNLLMNNAGIGASAGPWDGPDTWRRVLETNLWGVINGVQAFTPRMIAQGTAGVIINTGSKQGITCPPGNTAYNVSKAGVKVLTEALAHGLRTEGANITAHLLIPGSTFTGMTGGDHTQKPPGAWTPDQVIDAMLAGVSQGDFYILCPDNDVTPEIDRKRILWAAQDIIQNRPALSRWHPDYAESFKEFLGS